MVAIAHPVAVRRQHRRSTPTVHVGAARPARRLPSAGVRRRRRQFTLAVVVVLVAGAVWALGGMTGWLGRGPLAAPGPGPSRFVPAAAIVRVVQPGDTVWSIARSMQPHGEIRPLVDRLEQELHGRPLQVGDRLALN